MAIVDSNAEPARQMLKRIATEMGLGHLRQQSGVERAGRNPRHARSLAFALEHRDIEAERVPD